MSRNRTGDLFFNHVIRGIVATVDVSLAGSIILKWRDDSVRQLLRQ